MRFGLRDLRSMIGTYRRLPADDVRIATRRKKPARAIRRAFRVQTKSLPSRQRSIKLKSPDPQKCEPRLFASVPRRLRAERKPLGSAVALTTAAAPGVTTRARLSSEDQQNYEGENEGPHWVVSYKVARHRGSMRMTETYPCRSTGAVRIATPTKDHPSARESARIDPGGFLVKAKTKRGPSPRSEGRAVGSSLASWAGFELAERRDVED